MFDLSDIFDILCYKKRGVGQYFRDVSVDEAGRRGGGPAQLSSATAIFP